MERFQSLLVALLIGLPAWSAAQSIDRVDPSEIPANSRVTVSVFGERLSARYRVFIATRDGLEPLATPVVVSVREIRGVTPALVPGAYDVQLWDTDPVRLVDTLSRGLVAVASPVATAVEPAVLDTAGGETVTIRGTDLRTGTRALFGTLEVEITAYARDGTSMTGISPALTDGLPPGPRDVTVLNDFGRGVLRDGVTYQSVPAPEIESVTPNVLPLEGGVEVAIRGANLFDGTRALFGTQPVDISTWAEDGSLMRGVAPPIAVGTGPGFRDVTVTNDAGRDILVDGVEYRAELPPPTIESVSPLLVSTEGGTEIIVEGTNFASGDALQLGGRLLETRFGRTSLVALSPPLPAGFYDLDIVRDREVVATARERIEAAPPPEVHFVDPPEVCAAGGTTLRIQGANLRPETRIFVGADRIELEDLIGNDIGSAICSDLPGLPEGDQDLVVSDSRGAVVVAGAFTAIGGCTNEPGPQQIESSIAQNTRGERTVRLRWHNPIPYREILVEDGNGRVIAELPGDTTEIELATEADEVQLGLRGVDALGDRTKLTSVLEKVLRCDRPPPLNFVGKAGDLDLSLRGAHSAATNLSRCGITNLPPPPSAKGGAAAYQAPQSVGFVYPQSLLTQVARDQLTTGFVLEQDADAIEIAAYYEKIATDAGVELRCKITKVWPQEGRFVDELTFPDILLNKGKQWNCVTYFRGDRDVNDPEVQRCEDPDNPGEYLKLTAGEYLLDFYVVGGDGRVPYYIFADDAYDTELLIPGAPCGPYPLCKVTDLTGQRTIPVVTEVLAKVLIDAVLTPDHPHQHPWVRFQAIGTWLDENGDLHTLALEPDDPGFEYIWTVYDRAGENGKTQSSGSSSRHEMEVEDYGCYYIDLEVRDRRCPLSKKRSYQVVLIRCPISPCIQDGRPFQFLYPAPEPGGLYVIAGLNPEPGQGNFQGERPIEFRVVVAPTCSCGTEPCNAITYAGCPAPQLDDLEFRLAAWHYPQGQAPRLQTLQVPSNFITVVDECLDVEYGPKYFHVQLDDLGKIPAIPYPQGGDRHQFREVYIQAKGRTEPASAWHDIGQPFNMGNYPEALNNGFWTGHFSQDGFSVADETYHFVVKGNDQTESDFPIESSREMDLLGVAEVPSYDNDMAGGFISRFKMNKGVYLPETGDGTSSGQVMGNGVDGAPVRVEPAIVGGGGAGAGLPIAFLEGDGGGAVLEAPRYEWCEEQEIFKNQFSQTLFESILYSGTIGPVPVTIWASIGIGFSVDIRAHVAVFVSPFEALPSGAHLETHFYLLSDLQLSVPCEVRADILGGVGSVAVRLIPSASFRLDTHAYSIDTTPNAKVFYQCLFDLDMEVEGCINLLLAEVCVGTTIGIVDDYPLLGPSGNQSDTRPPVDCEDGGGQGAALEDVAEGEGAGQIDFSAYMVTSAPITVVSPDGQTTIDMWLDDTGTGRFFINESDPTEFPEPFVTSEFRGQYRDPAATFLSNTSALIGWTESFAGEAGFTEEELGSATSLSIAEQNLISRQDEVVVAPVELVQDGQLFTWEIGTPYRVADDPAEIPVPDDRLTDGKLRLAGDFAAESAWAAWVRYDTDFLEFAGQTTYREPCSPGEPGCICPPAIQLVPQPCYRVVTVDNWRPQLDQTGIWVRKLGLTGPLGPKQRISAPGINIEPALAVSPSGDVAYCVWVHDGIHDDLVSQNTGRSLVFSRYDKQSDTWSAPAEVFPDPDRFPGLLEPSFALKSDDDGMCTFTALEVGAPSRDTGLGGGSRLLYAVRLIDGVFGEPVLIHGKCLKREYGQWTHVTFDVPDLLNFSDLHHGPHPEWVMTYQRRGPLGTLEGSGDVMVTVLGQGQDEWTAPVSLTPEANVISNVASSLRGGVLRTVHLDSGPALRSAPGAGAGLPPTPSFVTRNTLLRPDLSLARCEISNGFSAPGDLATAKLLIENDGLAGSAMNRSDDESATGVEILFRAHDGEERVVARSPLPVLQPGERTLVELEIEMPHDPVELFARVFPNPGDPNPENDEKLCFFGTPPVTDLACAPLEIGDEKDRVVAFLTWRNTAIYDEILLYKDGSMLTALSGDSSTYVDLYVEEDVSYVYEVRARIGVSKSVKPACRVLIRRSGPTPRGFRRADSNADLNVDISDAVFTLAWLFTGGPPPACISAADANDSGLVDISDPTYTLNYLFLGGPTPPPPFDACGEDPTPDGLSCVTGRDCGR